MPIKCAGAPQKAMYLSCNIWERAGVLKDIDVQFHTAGAVLFGVPIYVPALMEYIERYGAHLNLESGLVAIDGEARRSEEHTSELQSLMSKPYAVFCLKKKKTITN